MNVPFTFSDKPTLALVINKHWHCRTCIQGDVSGNKTDLIQRQGDLINTQKRPLKTPKKKQTWTRQKTAGARGQNILHQLSQACGFRWSVLVGLFCLCIRSLFSITVCACVRVWLSERVCVWCERDSVCVFEREKDSLCVRACERETVCVRA